MFVFCTYRVFTSFVDMRAVEYTGVNIYDSFTAKEDINR